LEFSLQAVPSPRHAKAWTPTPNARKKGPETVGGLGKNGLENQKKACYKIAVSVKELKHELAALSATEQAEMAAFLFHLRHASDPEYQATIEQRLADKDPTHWLTPDEFEKRLNKA
jgi:hypothetical protein